MHFRHRQTDRQTDTDIVAYKREMYIVHLALKAYYKQNSQDEMMAHLTGSVRLEYSTAS